ncbi:hypothetical protein CONPUDRAFT_149239 [Coniophora puteana RWD-64-598 SS2]|uniref:Uncharacterized protein n=1 Tax=Coniophora puteana (strain RWD-64-598) TaxID=741705 RepID=A0A5M3N6Z3_CONPW|nr:uncharacterized protein CONPUDRAFT_149239 [Coniophora puteana RWD-64-598 SS2]EIW87209.1 hypothetical protein CONPUDRAFT_149239 [Coniophora puteana RWD-64-598 SS2]
MGMEAKATALVGLIVEELLYGFSILLFSATTWILVTDKAPNHANNLMIVIAGVLFILSTAHMSVVVPWLYEGFITSPVDPNTFFGSSTSPYVTAKDVIYILETLLAETFLVYRCYVVWQKKLLVVPFIIIDGASLTIGIWLIVNVAQSGLAFHNKVTHGLFVAVYVLILFTNLVSTGLLSYKVWTVERSAPPSCRGLLGPSLEVILECGVIYSLCLIIVVLTANLTASGLNITINMVGQMIPITFYAGLLRVRMSRCATDGGVAMSTWRPHGPQQDAPIEIHISNASEERRDTSEQTKCKESSDSSSV